MEKIWLIFLMWYSIGIEGKLRITQSPLAHFSQNFKNIDLKTGK
jgi:hypothetical protein